MKKITEILKQKWAEYLLEIIVITVGILGAFALDNWNQDRNERKDAEKILLNFQSEFIENQQKLKRVIDNHRGIASGCKNFVELCKPNPEVVPEDHLKNLIDRILMIPKYTPNDGAINSVISSGNISIITNDKLNKKLNSWQSKIHGYDYQAEILENCVKRDITPIISKYYPIQDLQILSDSLTSSHFDYDQTRLLSNLALTNHVELKRIDSEIALQLALNLQDFQEEILNLIREELEK